MLYFFIRISFLNIGSLKFFQFTYDLKKCPKLDKMLIIYLEASIRMDVFLIVIGGRFRRPTSRTWRMMATRPSAILIPAMSWTCKRCDAMATRWFRADANGFAGLGRLFRALEEQQQWRLAPLFASIRPLPFIDRSSRYPTQQHDLLERDGLSSCGRALWTRTDLARIRTRIIVRRCFSYVQIRRMEVRFQ